MRMEPLSTLEVPACASVTLGPGGTHLMLLELERMPATGEARRLCLETDQGELVCTNAVVRKDADGGDHHHHHH
jgi:copper(I)-binding protein